MELSGKQVSLWGKVAGGIYVVAFSLLNALLKWGVSTRDIILVGIFIASIGAPVDASKIAQNVRGVNNG